MSIKQTFYCLEIVLKQLSKNSETPVAFSLLSCQLICSLGAQSISSKEYPRGHKLFLQARPFNLGNILVNMLVYKSLIPGKGSG